MNKTSNLVSPIWLGYVMDEHQDGRSSHFTLITQRKIVSKKSGARGMSAFFGWDQWVSISHIDGYKVAYCLAGFGERSNETSPV